MFPGRVSNLAARACHNAPSGGTFQSRRPARSIVPRSFHGYSPFSRRFFAVFSPSGRDGSATPESFHLTGAFSQNPHCDKSGSSWRAGAHLPDPLIPAVHQRSLIKIEPFHYRPALRTAARVVHSEFGLRSQADSAFDLDGQPGSQADAVPGLLCRRMTPSKIADRPQPGRQGVAKEPPRKLDSGQCPRRVRAAAGAILPAERHALLIPGGHAGGCG